MNRGIKIPRLVRIVLTFTLTVVAMFGISSPTLIVIGLAFAGVIGAAYAIPFAARRRAGRLSDEGLARALRDLRERYPEPPDHNCWKAQP